MTPFSFSPKHVALHCFKNLNLVLVSTGIWSPWYFCESAIVNTYLQHKNFHEATIKSFQNVREGIQKFLDIRDMSKLGHLIIIVANIIYGSKLPYWWLFFQGFCALSFLSVKAKRNTATECPVFFYLVVILRISTHEMTHYCLFSHKDKIYTPFANTCWSCHLEKYVDKGHTIEFCRKSMCTYSIFMQFFTNTHLFPSENTTTFETISRFALYDIIRLVFEQCHTLMFFNVECSVVFIWNQRVSDDVSLIIYQNWCKSSTGVQHLKSLVHFCVSNFTQNT